LRQTPAAALGRLLPWLGGDRLPDRELRRRLGALVRAFDGSPAAGGLRAYAAAGEAELLGSRGTWPAGYEPIAPVGARALARLRERVLALVRKGFPYEEGQPPPRGERLEAFPSLRLGVRRVAPEAPRLSRAARRRYRTQTGAYEVWVDGALRDVVPYLVLRVLAGPGAASLARCPAPARGRPEDGRRCGRLFLLPATGRPRQFCSNACKVRAHAERTEGRMDKGHRRK